MIKNFEQLNIGKVRELAVSAVHENGAESYNTDFSDGFVGDDGNVFSDMFRANNEGLTFAGNRIKGKGQFDDWVESGEFRSRMRFISEDDIQVISMGDGFNAIEEAYNETDYIAPSSKILSGQTVEKLRQLFINNLLNTLK